MKHPQHDELIAIAQDMNTPMQVFRKGEWLFDCPAVDALVHMLHGYTICIKPKTIRIGDVEVPEPLRVAPEIGATYWRLNLSDRSNEIENWQGVSCEIRWLKTGLLQATEQGAQQMLAALIRQLGGML